VGVAVFGRDKKRRAKKFKAMKDDGEGKLHPARFERLPFSEPEKWWKMVPEKRDEIFRHIRLDHYGAQVNEATIVRLHDRRVPVEIDMFLKGSVVKGNEKAAEVLEIKRLQVAVANYAAVMQVLWPTDFSPAVIGRVLMEARWGEGLGDDRLRSNVVKRFFGEMVRENCGRAVRRQLPLVYKEAKEKWSQVLEAVCPQLCGAASRWATGGASVSGLTAAAVAAAGASQGQGQSAGNVGRGQGQNKKGNNQGFAFGRNRPARPPAMASGVAVCYGFNSNTSCKRMMASLHTCTDGKNNVFAHACNHGDAASGRYCLANHPRVANH
jgi:hypothetical protein